VAITWAGVASGFARRIFVMCAATAGRWTRSARSTAALSTAPLSPFGFPDAG
jgi:hypothetical protein